MCRLTCKSILTLLLICSLLIACPALAQGERVTLQSEYALNLSHEVSYPQVAVMRLTDQRIFFVYPAELKETTEFWGQFGIDNMINTILEITDFEGNSIWHDDFREHSDDEDSFFYQVILEPDGFIYQYCLSLNLNPCYQIKRSFDGVMLGYDTIEPSDSEKSYVFNEPPYRVSIYPFSEENPIRMEILHIPSGQTKTHSLLYGEHFSFFVTDGKLAVLSANEKVEHTLRFFDADCNLIKQMPVPFAACNQVLEDQEHLYFFVQKTSGIMHIHEYTLYTYDKRTDVFEDETIPYRIDGSLGVTLIQADIDGILAVLTDNETKDKDFMLCGKSAIALLGKDGTLTQIDDLDKRVEWVDSQTGQQFTLLVRDVEDGRYALRQYAINPA